MEDLKQQLLDFIKSQKIDTIGDISELHKEVILKCQFYYKERINPKTTPTIIKEIIDYIFESYDNLTVLLVKDPNLSILGEFFIDNSFKKIFLSDNYLGMVYKQLSDGREEEN